MAQEGMVHALKEAHRVLKPGGILIDLRPAAEHRRFGLGAGRRWKVVGPLHEILDDDHAANAAVRRVMREGYFREATRKQFLLDRVMDTVDEVRDWLTDFDKRRDLPSHEPLLKRLEQRMSRLNRPAKIAIRGHMTLGVLKRLDLAEEHLAIGANMILAILADASKIETLLNNLSEADFDLDDVSVIMQDVTTRNKIAHDAGPLRHANVAQLPANLKKAGVSSDLADRGSDAVKNGKVLVAMKVDPKYEQSARQMFQDMAAEFLS